MSKKKLIVKVSSLEESLTKFKKAWRKMEQGDEFDGPVEILSFEDPIALMKTLTPRRLELLQKLHTLGKISIRQLAKHLERDYSNVYEDIKKLHSVGIVCEDKENKFYVPWNAIITEVPLCLEKKHRNHSHFNDKRACNNHK